MIDAAKHWQQQRPHPHAGQGHRPKGQSTASLAQSSNGTAVPAPLSVSAPAPVVATPPARAAALTAVTHASAAVSFANSRKVVTPPTVPSPASSPLNASLPLSPRSTPLAAPSTATSTQPRSSWSDVCKHPAPAVSYTGAAHSLVHLNGGGGATASSSASSVPSSSPSSSSPISPLPVFHSAAATALPVFRPQRSPSTFNCTVPATAAAPHNRLPTASSPSPPCRFPCTSLLLRLHVRAESDERRQRRVVDHTRMFLLYLYKLPARRCCRRRLREHCERRDRSAVNVEQWRVGELTDISE